MFIYPEDLLPPVPNVKVERFTFNPKCYNMLNSEIIGSYVVQDNENKLWRALRVRIARGSGESERVKIIKRGRWVKEGHTAIAHARKFEKLIDQHFHVPFGNIFQDFYGIEISELPQCSHRITFICYKIVPINTMALKEKVIGLNKLLSKMYKQDTRLSRLLSKLEYSTKQIESLKSNFMAEVANGYIDNLKQLVTSKTDGERLFYTIEKRFGLDGNKPTTLQHIGDIYSISRERVRQLEKKALRICRHQVNIERLEKELDNLINTRL